jgi:outer membrane protein assembly factor BamB
MKRRALIFVSLWAAAIATVLVIWLAQPAAPDAPVRRADGAPTYGPDDRAPQVSRASLPVAPITEGPPRTFRNDRRHTARSPYEGPAEARVAWRYQASGRISGQAVVGRDGTVYVGSHDRHLHAVSAHGVLRWKRNLGDRIYATPLVDDDGNVYCGSDADVFTSFSPGGETRFRIETEGDADTGAVMAPDGTIHFVAGRDLWAIEKDGTVKWRFAARGKIFSTPAVDDDGTVYFGSQDDWLYAVAPDGRLRWSYHTRDDNDASPVIAGDGTIYFGSDDQHVYALSRDGDLVWSANVDGYVRAALALDSRGGVVVGVYGPRPRIVDLDARTGELVWFFPVTVTDSSEVGVHSGALVDRSGNIYVGAHDDYVYSLTADGQLRWIHATGGDVDGSPVLAPDGTLLVGADDGILYAFR